MPLPYSVVIAIAPSTPRQNWVNGTTIALGSADPNCCCSSGGEVSQSAVIR